MNTTVEDRAMRFCRFVAGCGLQGVTTPEPATVEDAVWRRLLQQVTWERLSGLAVSSVRDGGLELTDDQADALLTLHREAMVWSLAVERKLMYLAEAFDAEGIRFAVLKGASVAHTVYPDPSLRSFGDLDLLVHTSDYQRACTLLGHLGHARQRPEPRPGFEVRFGKASVHKHPEDGMEVDLHRTLVVGPFGVWIRPEELMERVATFPLGGRSVPRLDETGMLLNVAMHASLGWRPPRLVPLRDVVEVAARPEVDWRTLAEWTRRWRLTVVMRHAFLTASSTLGTRLAEPMAEFTAARPSRREARALEGYTGERRRRGGTALGSIRAIPGFRGKVAYAVALAIPQREFLAARAHGRKPSYLRRLTIPIGWMWARFRTSRAGGSRVRSNATEGGIDGHGHQHP